MDRILIVLIRGNCIPPHIPLELFIHGSREMFSPGLFPRLHGLLRNPEVRDMITDRSEDSIHHLDDRRGRSVRDTEIPGKDVIPASVIVVVLEDLEEEFRIASPP